MSSKIVHTFHGSGRARQYIEDWKHLMRGDKKVYRPFWKRAYLKVKCHLKGEKYDGKYYDWVRS